MEIRTTFNSINHLSTILPLVPQLSISVYLITPKKFKLSSRQPKKMVSSLTWVSISKSKKKFLKSNEGIRVRGKRIHCLARSHHRILKFNSPKRGRVIRERAVSHFNCRIIINNRRFPRWQVQRKRRVYQIAINSNRQTT